MDFNSGMDLYARMQGQEALLARLRAFRNRRPEAFLTAKDLTRSERRLLKEAANQNFCLKFFTGFQILNEEKALRKLLRGNRSLSHSKKELIYASARNYRIVPRNEKHRPRSPKQFKLLSFSIQILSFPENTGQLKIASRLGLTRQTVCDKCQHNPYLTKTPRLLRLAENIDRKPAQSLLRSLNLKGYFTSPKGQKVKLYRQLPNQYEVKHKNIDLTWSDHRSFQFSNKHLNQKALEFYSSSLLADASKSAYGPVKGTAKALRVLRPLPATKRISLIRLRSKNRSIVNAQDIGIREKKLKNILTAQNQYSKPIHEVQTSFDIQTGKNRYLTVDRTLRFFDPYRKLQKELNLINRFLHFTPENRMFKGSLRQVESRSKSIREKARHQEKKGIRLAQ